MNVCNEALFKLIRYGNQSNIRCLTRVTTCYSRAAAAKENKDWKKVLTEAESAVGYPTSFLSLRCLLNDEAANIALYIKKLIGTNHPLLKIARNLLMGTDNLAWGLIVLLVSKAAGACSNFTDMEHDHSIGILHSQRVLAEVTEMIRTSNMLHNGVTNIDAKSADMKFGNTVALLSGDYLLSTSFQQLANLRNHDLNEIMSSALRDLAEAKFIGPHDTLNRPLPSQPEINYVELDVPNIFGTEPFEIRHVLGNSKAEWTLRTLLGGASLLAKSCQGTLILAGHPMEFQKVGHLLGRNIGLAWQAAFEYEQFRSRDTQHFSLVSVPILFHLEYDPSFYSEFKCLVNDNVPVDYSRIKSAVLNGPALEKTLNLKEEFVSHALDALDNFKDSKAKDALANLIKSL